MIYNDIYSFNVISEIKAGKVVCCTDREKGENFYCNGMVVADLIQLLIDAENDKSNRFQFYAAEKEGEENA